MAMILFIRRKCSTSRCYDFLKEHSIGEQSMALRRREVYVFPPFRFFPESGELHGKGVAVRCPSQAAVVLEALLARAGQVVTREQLRAKLWPEGDSQAYDDAINKAISYLRQALRDRSKSPKYIETLPKRGYRFVAPTELQLEGDQAETLDEQSGEPLSEDVAAVVVEPEDADPVEASSGNQPRKWRLVVAFCLFIAVAASIAVWRSVAMSRARDRAQPRSYLRVGIAPFEANGADASGLAESFRLDITDALAQVPQLRVSASHVTPSDTEGRRAMLALQTDVLVFGTLSFKGDRIQLQLELARGSDATHIAAFRYDVARKDLIGLRQEVQRDLLLALNASRTREGAAVGSTDDAEAYAIFLQARTHLQQWDPASWTLAAEEFRQAIARDPGFARAYSGLATTLITMTEHGTIPQQQGYEEARRQVMKALELDPQLAEGHAVLGNISYSHDWDLVRAEQEYRQAIALDPGHSHYHVWLASLLCTLGRFRESIEEVNLAHSLDPSWISPYLAATSIYHSAGQPERSLAVARQLVAMEPKSAIAHNQLGWSCWYAGLYPQAVGEWRTMAMLDRDKDRMALEDEGAQILQKNGMRAYAEQRLKAIESGKAWRRVSNDFVPSEWFIYADQRDNAIAALSSQIDRRDPAALQIAVDPAYASLRQDPRYLMLLRRVHFSVPVLLGRNDWHSIWE
jgi:DNA-binding winged helix-turn-helix (wHTH) protein/Tfp pilus assembly protein PilF